MLTLVFVGYVLLSHVVLPTLNLEDFLLFSIWPLFRRPVATSVTDLTWDNGRTFLLRDYSSEAKRSGVDLRSLHYLLSKGDFSKIREIHKDKLLDFCRCEGISLLTIRSNFYSHFLKKESSETLRAEDL